MIDKSTLKTYILLDIKKHTKDNPIYSYQIEQKYQISGTSVREAVHSLRTQDNIPVCSGSKGYFYPRDRSDVLHTIAHLRSRAKRNVDAANGISKHYEDESGQLNLL